jgi:putative acetyltransferase
MKIESVTKKDYSVLIKIWEASVRATHDFLSDNNISFLKPLILEEYFNAVELKCIKKKSGQILGFIGTYIPARFLMLFTCNNLEIIMKTESIKKKIIKKYLTT